MAHDDEGLVKEGDQGDDVQPAPKRRKKRSTAQVILSACHASMKSLALQNSEEHDQLAPKAKPQPRAKPKPKAKPAAVSDVAPDEGNDDMVRVYVSSLYQIVLEQPGPPGSAPKPKPKPKGRGKRGATGPTQSECEESEKERKYEAKKSVPITLHACMVLNKLNAEEEGQGLCARFRVVLSIFW